MRRALPRSAALRYQATRARCIASQFRTGASRRIPGRSMPAMSSSRSGPWAPDVLGRSASDLPLAVKRGYHRHFRPQGNAALGRPVLDAENGYVLAPMEQGIRLTTGVEFAARDAAPTPVQFDRAAAGGAQTCFHSASRSSHRRAGSARGRALPIPGR